MAAYFSYLGDCKNPERTVGYLAQATGDTFSYIGSIDNFVTEGVFYFWNGERRVLAGRMPYYGATYYVLRLFFDKPLASDLFVIIQIFFDSLATVYFGKLCAAVLKRRTAFWFGYALYLLSFNFSQTVLLLAPESLSMSYLVLFLYAFHTYWRSKSESMMWAANIFISLAFLLKPYLAPIFIAFWVVYCRREGLFAAAQLKALAGRSALFSLPLVLLLSPWFVRNIIVLRQPIATQESLVAGYKETKADIAFRRFSGGWGADFTFWDAESAACYFKLNPPFECSFILPPVSLTDKYDARDIEDVRADYLEFQRNPSPELEEIVVNKFDRLTQIYRREKPFMFYVGSGFLRIKTMLWHTNNYNLPIHPSSPCFRPYQLVFKIIQFIIYALGLAFGFIGLIFMIAKRKISLLLLFIPVFLMTFFGFYVWNMEARYFSHAYPVMLLGLVVVLMPTAAWIKNVFAGKADDSLDKFD